MGPFSSIRHCWYDSTIVRSWIVTLNRLLCLYTMNFIITDEWNRGRPYGCGSYVLTILCCVFHMNELSVDECLLLLLTGSFRCFSSFQSVDLCEIQSQQTDGIRSFFCRRISLYFRLFHFESITCHCNRYFDFVFHSVEVEQ